MQIHVCLQSLYLSFVSPRKFVHKGGRRAAATAGRAVDKGASLWMRARIFHSGAEVSFTGVSGRLPLFHSIHRSTTSTSTVYILQMVFSPLFSCATNRRLSCLLLRGERRFTDCLNFFNRS